MTTITAEEREAIRESFARLLNDMCGETDVRRIAEQPTGYDRVLWQGIAGLGLTALLVPVAHGGVGGGPLEIEAIMETAGAVLLPAPLLASSVLATTLLAASDDLAAKERLFPGLVDGSRIATLALTGDSGRWDETGIDVTATAQDGSWSLHGTAAYVLYGADADILLVAARTPDSVGIFEVDATGAGISRVPQQAFDRTQRLARLTFSGAMGRAIVGGAAGLESAIELGHVALAGEQAGAARRLFDLTIDYIRTRVQFGRPVGGFQAIKHMAADLLIEVESCTSAARNAAQALTDARADAKAAVALAAFACAECFNRIAFDSIQMHGGIGFTSEYPAHLYLRRARASAQLLGSPEQHRDRFLSTLEQAA